ncbi:DUF1553 domain-containing protein [Porifericola rhodea]|uniref:DUF1553 domain-containing protein n=1 Tax=Porifericola rhodea TaxID=930972 RepID=UPI002665279D|nr:DUF1553 domain-containing protein [Porifericola rhodea]WKN29704.1 DUF1553 domain-containing protein [Porifericola rhodea]
MNISCKTLLSAFFVGAISACQVDKPEEILEAEARIPDKVSYNFHVKPILSDRCFACHGPDEKNRGAELRLDLAEEAKAELKENKGKYAIVDGELADSEIYHRILSDDPELQMPPPESNLQLSTEEKAILLRWIEQGANYEPHWAFVPPQKTTPPKADKSWVANEIDHFVYKQMQSEGLSPSPEADRETLIRRLSFDLRGLPPSLEEIDHFVADKSPRAYEKLVEKMLASPAYGERMAAHWLDVARYADSDGYLDDKHRDFSPWRDWLIEAFNQNMPYDRFATLQLAGDLLPDAGKEEILPTAFNRLHKKNSEAGIVFEEYRVEYVADRTNTLGKAFLGLSLECARCHDHKYDPVSQEDYFSMFAFFNSTHETGSPVYGPDQTPGPALLLSEEKTDQQIADLTTFIQKQEAKIEQSKSDEDFEHWLASTPNLKKELESSLLRALTAYYPLDHFEEKEKGTAHSPNLLNRGQAATLKEAIIKDGVKGKAFFVSDYNSLVLGDKVGWYERTQPFSVDLWVYTDTVYEEAGVFTHCEDLRLGLKGYSLYLRENKLQFIIAHSWPQNAIELVSEQALPAKAWSRVTISYDGSSRAEGVKIYLNGNPLALNVQADNLYKGILYEPDIHTYGFRGFHLGSRDKITPMKNGGLDEIRIFNTNLSPLEVSYLTGPEESLELLKQAQNASLLKEYYFQRYQDPSEQKKLTALRDTLNQLMNTIPEIMVMGDLDEARTTYLLERGNYNQAGKEVIPATPASILSFPDSLPPNRLGLAQWMFAEDNPLTARVIVNRMWQLHFGKGLVSTSDDLGNQGALPTHPELLDYLSVWLREHNWDLKALHTLIVTSATYRQSSKLTPELLEQDPENLYLARAPRFRLPAEMIRDNALAISGLLVNKVGGKSVYPYQPEGLWDELSNKSWRYPYLQENGEGLYRRSIYTIWKRTSPPPSMLIFDMPQRGECTVRRTTTSTPLQALVLLNDPQYIEAARVLAENVLQQEESVEAALHSAFRLLTGRKPQAKELELMQAHYQDEYQKFSRSPQDLNNFLSIGEQELKSEPSEKLAALAVVTNSIMNTHEAYTRK